MTRKFYSTVLLLGLIAAPASAQLLAAFPVVSGLTGGPLGFVQNPTFPNTQHILEKVGRILVLQNGAVLAPPFLDIVAKVDPGGEKGLLGLAFAPDYNNSGRFFVHYVSNEPGRAGHTVIARFTRSASNPLVADPASQFDLVWPGGTNFIVQPYGNHKGGRIMFGPDGMLYFALGDGGSGGDPENRAQNPSTLLGKMIRININVPAGHSQGYVVPPDNPFLSTPGVLPEIWAFGLRNPWQWSFDDPSRGGTGAILIADVGEGAWEEINYEPPNSGGRNYGWSIREGSHDFRPDRVPFNNMPLTNPIHEYGRNVGSTVIGGFVYRGSALGSFYFGRYFFADIGSNRVWSMPLNVNPTTGEATAGTIIDHTPGFGSVPTGIASFGVDASGELYMVSLGGTVYRLMLSAGSIPVPGGCAPPDPFAAIGGGTCFNGGWLPPGITPPGATPPAPAPPTPPAPPPPGSGSCATPDPFGAIGGGTCFNGGWLAPGMTPPSGSTPAPPTPTPGSPTPTPPAPGAGTCVTPDPFAAMGGGTCFNGGWLAPGMTPPSGLPAPPPPSTPPPPTACIGTDPFTAMGGGICINGGWVPLSAVGAGGGHES
jgi:glucose/arabinose dehydrogenase